MGVVIGNDFLLAFVRRATLKFVQPPSEDGRNFSRVRSASFLLCKGLLKSFYVPLRFGVIFQLKRFSCFSDAGSWTGFNAARLRTLA